MADYINISDEELAVFYKRGDEKAYTAIYKRYWKQIYVIALKRLGDEHDAEEVVQDIFLNFWNKRFTFELTTGFRNYFAIAVKFEIIDLMRKRANVERYALEMGTKLTDQDYSTLRKLDMIDLQQQLQLSVNALPEKCKLVFNLKHEKGYSQKEISEELGISEKTVEAHLSTARKKLRASFGSILPALLLFYFLK